MFRPFYFVTTISRYPLNKRRNAPRSVDASEKGTDLVFFPGIEPPFFDRSALSSATKPPIICILHTNSTQNTHTCSPVNTVGLYKSAKQESFPAT